jgi:methylated-DNA-[protein]-cysteine S-methyltransferase
LAAEGKDIMTTIAAEPVTYRTIHSPVGPLTLAGVGSTLSRLVIDGQRREPDRRGWQVDDTAFPDVAAQLDAYFNGNLTRFDVELSLAGTDFQRRVWDAVQSIPHGETRSYAWVADQIGSPGASRAVGVAVGRNPVPIIVACHRVIGAAGALTGYVGGMDCKKALLALEVG